jgi:hypothetical protein
VFARRAAEMSETKSSAYAMACARLLEGEREAALATLERFPGRGWVEPALARDPNLAGLRNEPRFRRVVAWMRAQPVDRTFADWGRSR